MIQHANALSEPLIGERPLATCYFLNQKNRPMNIRYTTVTAALCCTLLSSGCVYDKKRIVSTDNTAVTSQGLETTEDPGPKAIIQPRPVGVNDDQEYMDHNREQNLTGFPGEVAVLPDMQYVKDRIFEYGRKLDRWKELDEQSVVMDLDEEASEEMVRCFRDLQKVLNGYNRLHESLLRQDFMDSENLISGSEVMSLEQRDISFLESSCARLLKSGDDRGEGWEQRGEQADLPQIETLIERYAGSHEFEEIVQVWQQIPSQQLDRVHLNTRISYGNALMSLHQENEAAKVYQEIIDLMSASDDQRTDILSLRKILADLYTASGDYDKAEDQYLEISKDYSDLAQIEDWATLQLSILERSEVGSLELQEYSSLLRNYLGYSPQRDGYKLVWQSDKFLAEYPYSPVSSNVDIIKSSTLTSADKWLQSFLDEVDAMAAEEQFQDALLKLENLPEDILSGEKLIEIRKKRDDLTLAEAVSREKQKIEKMQAQQRQWNDALLLIDKGEFDEAIEILTTMLDTDYALKAENKIAEVSLLAARAERRKAADLFIRFTKTTDIESRKKLLIESRRRLVDILIKYPDVGITEKVMGNIRRVEKEMNTIDPMLISQSELVGAAEEVPVEQDAFDTPVDEMIPATNDAVLQEQNIE
jgi:tetratricopeptide (TPR) repeat protein